MKLFYGWVIVGAAMVVTCVGFGAMFSLGVFLQPMSEGEGWSRTGISTAALLNFLGMGVGSFFWGALSDRLGTRAVVLLGGVLLGFGTVMASQAPTMAAPSPSPGILRAGDRAHDLRWRVDRCRHDLRLNRGLATVRQEMKRWRQAQHNRSQR